MRARDWAWGHRAVLVCFFFSLYSLLVEAAAPAGIYWGKFEMTGKVREGQ